MGAFGGRRDIMENIAPLGPVYQAGTLSGNPLAVTAGLVTLKKIQAPGFYDRLATTTRSLCDGLAKAALKHGVAFSARSVGGMFGMYFRAAAPSTYAEVLECDKERFKRFFHGMLERGNYLAPSAYEAGFVSSAHTNADIAATISAAGSVFSRVE
jgi:glutamate-1-semialdehyde 2,1-aminomutase